jgi:hypothetical protein
MVGPPGIFVKETILVDGLHIAAPIGHPPLLCRAWDGNGATQIFVVPPPRIAPVLELHILDSALVFQHGRHEVCASGATSHNRNIGIKCPAPNTNRQGVSFGR